MNESRLMLPRRKKWRALAALLAAPLPVSVFYALVFWSITGAASSRYPPLNELFLVWLGVLMLMAGASLVLIWVFHAIAFRRRWRKLGTYLVAGGSLGLVAATLIAAIYVEEHRADITSLPYLVGTLIGAAVFLALPTATLFTAFWFIRRPDKDYDGDPLHVFD
jgi:hypothetical protein